MPANAVFGRRGTIFITCVISAVTVLWQAFTNTWWHMFIARFALGLGIGPKSATVPIYAAETTPPAIRGALVMQWQMWTAFGIMLGFAADLAFYGVRDRPGVTGLNWRLMLASAMVPAVVVCAFVYACPESPRWYMSRGRHDKAYRAMVRLRYSRVQAARDVFYMHTLLEAEAGMKRLGRSKLLELVTVPRNRRALVASEIVMFMQQVSRALCFSAAFTYVPHYLPHLSLRPCGPSFLRQRCPTDAENDNCQQTLAFSSVASTSSPTTRRPSSRRRSSRTLRRCRRRSASASSTSCSRCRPCTPLTRLAGATCC